MDNDSINKIFGISESFKLPDVLMADLRNMDEQEKVVEKIKEVEFLIEAEQNIINNYKGIKEWYLDKLFP